MTLHMKTLFLGALAYCFSLTPTFAAENILWIENSKLRKWEVGLDQIPVAIKSAIDFFLSIAGTIAVIFVIIWAYKILFWSLQQDKTKWRDTIIMALWGFALAALAWVIIQTIVANLA